MLGLFVLHQPPGSGGVGQIQHIRQLQVVDLIRAVAFESHASERLVEYNHRLDRPSRQIRSEGHEN